MRRGAASCRAVLSSCSVTAAVTAAVAGVVTAKSSWVAERRRRCTLSQVWTAQPASLWSWPSRMSGRRPRRWSRCPPWRSVQWSGGRPVSTRPVSRRSGRSGYPDGHASVVGGRCIGRPHRAGSWNGWVRPAHPRCAAGWRCRCGRRAAWSSLPSRDWRGRDGRTVGSAVARRRVGGRPGPPPRIRRGRGAAFAAWPTEGAGPAPGAGRLAGEYEREQVLPGPRHGVLGRCRRAVRPWG